MKDDAQEQLSLKWAVELQSLAQAGLTYGRDVYDRERYERIRAIAVEMMAHIADMPLQKVRDLFCNENGYQTPKIDTRAAIFENEKILLVKENDGYWSLPGGWCDVNLSIAENTVKEVKEEAGLDVEPRRLIAVQDRAKHNLPVYAYGICKIFVLCTVQGGSFSPNIETSACDYFALHALPELSTAKNTAEQIELCFRAHRAAHWETLFD